MTAIADACPYPRPFPAGFVGCPAYEAVRFVPLDTRHRPLNAIWTCQHLDVAASTETPQSRFYARCRLGDVAARERWAREVKQERLRRVNAIRQKIDPEVGPYIARLWEAKGEETRARQAGEPIAPARTAVREAAAALAEAQSRTLRAHAVELEAAGFPVEPVLRIVEWACAEFPESPTGALPEPPEALLAPIPSENRVFFGQLFRPRSESARGDAPA